MVSQSLQVKLLGGFSLSMGDQPLTGINTPRLQSLAAYLILHHSAPQSRQHVAFLFWPDATDAQARNNLRQLLHHLRAALPKPDTFLYADATTLYWQSKPALTLDVDDFEAAIVQARASRSVGDDATARAALERAVGLYRGDLLPSCYDDWIVPERARLRDLLTHALDTLLSLLEAQRDYATALLYAQRLCDLDPLRDTSQLRLLRLHELNGDRVGAMRIFRNHAILLKNELGVEPGDEMRQAYERLKRVATSSGTARVLTDPAGEVPATQTRDEVTPLIGRRREWELLLDAWQRATAGQSRFVLVSGDAGVGKSRLVEDLLFWVSRRGFASARTRAYAAEGRLSYAPVIDWLRGDAICPLLTRLDAIWLSEVARLMPELTELRPGLAAPPPMNDYAQRQHLFEALARAALGANQPLLLVIDDLQWCDQDTLEWLRFLLRFDARAPLLVVGTARSDELNEPSPLRGMLYALRGAGQLTEIELQPLNAADTATLAATIMRQDLTEDEGARLFRETEGNPLFTVEMARANLEEPAPDFSSLASTALPLKVHAVIAGRLARLTPAALALAQLAATIGREFTFEALLAASDADEDSIARSLDELWQRRILRDHNGDGYDFSHDKIREVIYAGIGSAQRRRIHHRVAQVLAAIHAHDLDPISARLAAHYERGGIYTSATQFYQRAAEVEHRVFAYQEVVRLLNQGLALLKKLPQNTQRDMQELEMLTILCIAYFNTAFFARNLADTTELLIRAQALSQRLGRPADPSILRALAYLYNARSQFLQSRRIGEELIRIAEERNDPILIVEGHLLVGISHSWHGSFVAANLYLSEAIRLYDPRYSRIHIERYSWDPKVTGLCRLAQDLWCLGYPDQALAAQLESQGIARSLNHPFSYGYALFFGSMLRVMMGDPRPASKAVEETLAFCEQNELLWWLMFTSVLHGWTIGMNEELERGIAKMEAGLAKLREYGTTLNVSLFAVKLAQLYLKSGQTQKCLELVRDMIALYENSEDQWYAAELHRAHGDALLAQGNAEVEAEAAYRTALDIAQRQNAKSFELRAAASLADLWRSQCRNTEARGLLQPICDWFTEGFDMPDLKAARVLLDSL